MSFIYSVPSGDWLRIMPELIMVALALVVMAVDAVLPARHRGSLAIVAALGVAVAIGGVIMQLQTGGNGPAFNGMVTSDALALFAALVILAATLVALLLSPGYIERQGVRQQGEFYALVLLAATGMILMAAATNLMTIFLGLELLSLPLYVLAAFAPGQNRAHEAGMKYFLLSSFASGFLLYGMALIYGATGQTGLVEIQRFVTSHAFVATSGFGPLLVIGMGLLAVGLAFKVSAIPFHAWTPDVYQGAPTPVTALMSVGTKTAAFVALARVFDIAFGSLASEWQGIIWGLAILTMIGGNLLAATQTNVKRLLAYSSVAHAGYLLIGIALGTRLGIAATLFYLAAYAVMNVGAFGVVVALEGTAGVGTELADFQGLGGRRPVLAGLMTVFLFALAGVPATAGFVAKYSVFFAAVVGGHGELTIIGVITSMISFYYYLRIIWAMYFAPAGPPPADAETLIVADHISAGAVVAKRQVVVTAPLAVGVVIGLTLALIGTIALGIVPGPIVDLARQAAGLP